LGIDHRIFDVRKKVGLNQADFGKRIGVTRSAICNYENGSRSVGEQVILAICREFNVSEAWLRTGKGDMLIQQDRECELAFMVQKLLSGESSDFKRRLITVLAGLKEEQWFVLEEKMNEIIGSRGIPDPEPAGLDITTELDADGLTTDQRAKLDADMEAYQKKRIAELRAGKRDTEMGAEMDVKAKLVELEHQAQETAARVAAMEEEDAAREAAEELSTILQEKGA